MSILRRQILPLLLIEVVTDSIDKHTPAELSRKPIEAVRAAVDKLHRLIGEHYDVSRLKVDGQLEAMQEVVRECWVDETVSTGQIINACLLLAADIAHQAPPSKKGAWEDLEVALADLYELIDPDLKDLASIEAGSRVGEKFKEVTW